MRDALYNLESFPRHILILLPKHYVNTVTSMHSKCYKFSVAKNHFVISIDSVGQKFRKDTVGNSFV